MLDTFFPDLVATTVSTLKDVLPILLLIVVFQVGVLRQPIPQPRRLVFGGIFVVLGLVLFLMGLERALFPIGRLMAEQLVAPSMLLDFPPSATGTPGWASYALVYLFAAMIGFSTTLAEPSLLAVAVKAQEVSGGTIGQWGLRVTVALGVGFGISLGAYRIVSGTPLHLYILAGYVIVVVQTFFAPNKIVGLAYDSGGVTTSTVTVPLVTALGLGLSEAVPGRNPALDGFGLIAFASLFPIIAVMGYAQCIHWAEERKTRRFRKEGSE